MKKSTLMWLKTSMKKMLTKVALNKSVVKLSKKTLSLLTRTTKTLKRTKLLKSGASE